MTTINPQTHGPSKKAPNRVERMAKALRENLIKRKQQQRSRDKAAKQEGETK